MEQLQVLTDFWLEWQIRGFLFSLLILFVAIPAHLRSPIWRHWVLVSGGILLIVLPLLWALLPEWRIAIIPSELPVGPFVGSRQIQYPTHGNGLWVGLLIVVHMAMAACIFVRYRRAWVAQDARLLASRSPDLAIRECFDQCLVEVGLTAGSVELVVADSNESPCTLGWIRPKVVLPQQAHQWAREDLRIVLIHELQHIRRRDWLWQQLLVLMVLCYPLNPFVWKIKSRARALAEESVDKLSLALNIAPMKYAAALLDQLRACRQMRSSVAVHLHQRLDIVERVNSLISEPYSWPTMRAPNSVQLSLLVSLIALPVIIVQPTRLPIREWAPPQLPPVATGTEAGAPVFIEGYPVVEERPQPATPIVSPESPPTKPVYSFATQESELNYWEEPVAELTDVLPSDIPLQPRAVHLERPAYPKAALRKGWESTVNVEFDLNDQGGVINPRVISAGSYDSRAFEEAALSAISASWYEVREPKGQAYIQQDLTQTYVFKLVDDERLSPSDNEHQHPP